MIEIDCDPQASITLVFESVHLTQSNCHAQPGVNAAHQLRLVGALGARFLDA